jgi:putative membrane-bound dehydrogenase-like protein
MRWVTLLLSLLWTSTALRAEFRAGAAKVDVTPPAEMLPVIQNGGFLSQTVGKVSDPLHARALVIDDGTGPIAICVVDSCMLPTPLCDKAKAIVAERTGIKIERMLISANHTHAAPSVMDMCLGTDRDPEYTAFLPGKIAEAIVAAHAVLAPAEAGWARFDASAYTKTRRWITAPDKMGTDPFGERTVRAMMHPGHQNPNYVGESGPEDPWFTVLSVRGADGQPLCLLGNFSMHYFGGHPGLSADYFGQYCKLLEAEHGGAAILSQGTSGDLYHADYSKPRAEGEISILRYSQELATMTAAAVAGIEHRKEIPVAMTERRLTLKHRTPDEKRLEWARAVVAAMGDRLPKKLPEVYARQAIHLHENPSTKVVLQALRIGDLGITAIPNEVYAITGLHLKARSPLPLTMNIELANGATGYIPPPEQHHLGGYTTWPAVTAGLAVDAEPEIVETLLGLLEEVAGAARKPYEEPRGAYAEGVRNLKPVREWRLGDMAGSAAFEPGVAFQLPGVEGVGFPDAHQSRASVFAGGRMKAEAELGRDYSVTFWFWNGLQTGARPVTAYLFSRGENGDQEAPGDHIGIGGSHLPTSTGKLIAFNGNAKNDLLVGKTPLETRRWYHCVVLREGEQISVYLDGALELEGGLAPTHGGTRQIFLGGRSDNFANLEGRIDEAALFDRVLTGAEIAALYGSAGIEPAEPALSPEASLRKTHVPEGFAVELVASEPLVRDPVAVDWAEDGSVWVAEMADYPSGENGVQGKVVRLIDKDGDHKPDQRQELIEQVAFPTGVMAYGKGVIVSAAGEIFYAEDTDGDGTADLRETWFKGFMEGNQQLRVNGLRWGMDDWIYCASGGHQAGFGVDTVIDCMKTGEKVNLGSRDFRFRPTGEFEPVAGPSQFGRVCDDEGNWFGVQNAHPLWHYVLEDRYLSRNPEVPAPDPRKQLRGVQPAVHAASKPEKRFHGFDHVGRYTSACGISIYRDEVLFPRLPGTSVAFTCEPFSNLVQRHILTAVGPSFTAERAPDGERDFFTSEDQWCRPVMSRTAPDGSLWVVDMYRFMIEHPQWLPPAAQAEMRPHEYSGQGRGRIYRISRKGAEHAWQTAESGTTNGIAKLIAAREQFRHGTRRDPHGNQLLALLSSPESATRRHALPFVESLETIPDAALALAEDPDPKVRLQAAFTYGEFDDARSGAALLKIAKRDGDDPYFAAAVLSSAVPHYRALAGAATDLSEPIVAGLLKMEKRDPQAFAGMVEGLLGREGTARWRLLAATSPAMRATVEDQATAVLGDAAASEEERIAAMGLASPRHLDLMASLMGATHSIQLQSAAIATLVRLGASARVLDTWQTLSPATRAAAEEVLLTNTSASAALLDRVADKTIAPVELSANTRERLLGHKDTKLKGRAQTLLSGLASTDRAGVVKTFAPALEAGGDPAKGQSHFTARCSACHQLGDLGRAVGPDLTGISDRSPSALLTAILDPSRSVEPRYLAYTATLKNGESVYGLVAAETANSVILHLLDGNERILKRDEIASLTGTGKSAMPAGIEAGMTPSDMADLLAFLASKL